MIDLSNLPSERESRLRQNYRIHREDPEKSAAVIDIASRTGLPESVVSRNTDKARQSAEEPDWRSLSKDAPKTSELLADPNFFKLAKDDTESLSALEKYFNAAKMTNIPTLMWRAASDMAKGTPLEGLGESLSRTPETFTQTLLLDPATEITDPLSRPRRTTGGATDIGYTHPVTGEFIDQGIAPWKRYSPAPDSFAKRINEISRGMTQVLRDRARTSFEQLPEDVQRARTEPGVNLEKIFDVGGQIPAYIAAFLAPGRLASKGLSITSLTQAERAMLAGAATNSAIIGSQTYNSAYQAAYDNMIAGGMHPEEAQYKAMDAAKGAAKQMRVIAAITGAFGEGPAMTATRLRQVPSAAARGVVSEVTEEIAQSAAEKFAAGEHLSLEEMAEVAALAAILGGGVNTGISTMSALMNASQKAELQESEQVVRSEKEQEVIDQIAAATQESRLYQRHPETFQKFIDQVSEGADNIYLDPAKLDDAALEQIRPLAEDQIDSALETGGDVLIPMRDFVTLAPEAYEVLRPHIRLSSESLSQQEMLDTPSRVQDLLDEANRSAGIKEQADRIFTEVRDQLVETGRLSERNANLSAQIIPAYVTTQAARTGKSVQEVYESMGLEIKGPSEPEGGLRQSVVGRTMDRVRGKKVYKDVVPEDLQGEIERLRTKVAELETELRTSEKTGMKNFRAFGEDESLGWKHVAAFDMDGLKRLNDNLSHQLVDTQFLPALGAILSQFETDTFKIYHNSGDEFGVRARDNPEKAMQELQDKLDSIGVRLRFQNQRTGEIEEYVYEGIGISYGTGTDFETADQRANQQKVERLLAGKREDPREKGPSRRLRRAAPEGEQADFRRVFQPEQLRLFQARQTPSPEGVSRSGRAKISPMAEDQRGGRSTSQPQPQERPEAVPKEKGVDPKSATRVYRAHTDDDVSAVRPFSAWTTEEETAQAYTDNQGFGGPNIRSVDVDLSDVLDVADIQGMRGKERLAEALGYENPQETAQDWQDSGYLYPWEESSEVKKRLQNSEFKWLRYEDDFPAGADTVVPLKEINLDPESSPRPQRAGQTETPAFEKWFGDSKVVDESGGPKVVYHGTPAGEFEFFDTYASNYGLMGQGGYFTEDPAVASEYTEKGAEGMRRRGDTPAQTVYPAYLSIQNPIDMSAPADTQAWADAYSEYVDPSDFAEGMTNEDAYREVEETLTQEFIPAYEGAEIMQGGLLAMGYDGITHIGGGRRDKGSVSHRVWIAFEPTQIKSATGNRGTFDPNDPNILRQQDRGAIDFIDEGAIIRLFEASDLSTFLHEAGHLFLQMEAKRADPANLTKDQKRILGFLSVKSFDQIGRDEHEQFARAFEAYLFEGKAPSLELRDAFTRFREWLVNIYRSLSGLNVELNDDIRGVFDRLLATDEQIALAHHSLNYDLLFDSAESAGMTRAEWDDYQKQAQRATDKPKADLQQKILSQLRRRTQKWWKEELSATKAEVREKLEEERVYRATASLRGKPANRSQVKEILGADIPPKLRGTTAKDSDVSIEDVAIQHGYDSAHAMLKDIQESPTLAEAATQEAERRMVAKHGDILNDGSLEQEAMEAAHNEERGKLILRELRQLDRRGLDRETLQNEAKQVISRAKLSELRPDKYRRAEIRAAQNAREALNAGDRVAAAQHKAQQAANFYLWREATSARERAEAIRKRLSAAQKRSYSASEVNPEYIRNMKLLLAAYDMRRGNRVADVLRVAQWAKNQLNTDTATEITILDPNLQAVLEAEQAGTLESVELKKWKDMTLEELRGVDAQIKHLRYLGGKLSDIEKAKRTAEHKRVADSIRENFKDKKRPQKGTAKRYLSDKAFGFGSQVMFHADTQLRRLDGWKDNGLVYRSVKRPIDDAVTQNLLPMQERVGKELAKLFTKYYTKPQQKRMNARQSVPGTDHVLTKWEMIAIALNWGNDTSREALLSSISEGQLLFKQEDVGKILNQLEKKDWDFVQEVWDYVDSFWPELSKLDRDRKGIVPPKVPASEVKTRFGTYRGGYYPLKYDASESMRVTEEQAQEMINAVTLGRFSKARTKDGMLKERVGSGGRPVRLDIGVLYQHLNEVVTLISMSDAVTDVQRLIASKPFKEAISETGNLEALKALDVWLKDAAAGEVISADVISKIARHLRTGFSASKIGWNFGTILVQPLGLLQSMPVIGYRNVWKGVSALARNPVGKNGAIRNVQEVSHFMRERGATFNKDIRDTLQQIRGSRFLPAFVPDWAVDSIFAGIVFTQRYVDTITWLGAYEKGKAEGIPENDLINYADRTVARSQASGIWSDRTPVERGTISSNIRQAEFVRMWTALGSYFFAKGNVAYEQFSKTNFRSPRQAFRFSIDMLCLFTVEAIIVGLLRGTWPDGDDEESKTGFIVKETASSLLASIPFAREFASEMQGFRSGPTLTQFFKELGEAAEQVSQGEFDAALVKSINDVGGMVFKYPSSATNRFFDSLVKDIQGEDVDPIDYLMWREKD